jgi:hypothetical protein
MGSGRERLKTQGSRMRGGWLLAARKSQWLSDWLAGGLDGQSQSKPVKPVAAGVSKYWANGQQKRAMGSRLGRLGQGWSKGRRAGKRIRMGRRECQEAISSIFKVRLDEGLRRNKAGD